MACKREYEWQKFFCEWRDEKRYERRTFFRGSTPCGIRLNFAWRFLMCACTMIMTICFNIHWKRTNPEDFAVNHLYFTNWGDYTNTIYFGLALILYVAEEWYQKETGKIPGIDLEANHGHSDESNDSSWHPDFWTCIRSITWLFHCCALQMELCLTVVYWGVITCNRREDCHDLSYYNIYRHGIIALVLFLDFWISSFPIRLFHSAWGTLFGCFYIAASYKGHVLDGIPPVYNELDWSERPYYATAGVMFLMSLAGSLIVQHVYFGFQCWCRTRCIKAYAPSEDESPARPTPALPTATALPLTPPLHSPLPTALHSPAENMPSTVST